MKSIGKILFVVAVIALASCSKELNKTPIGIVTEEAPDTKTSVEASVTGSYQLLSNTLNLLGTWDWAHATVFRDDFILQDIASGDMLKKWSPDGDQAWMDQFADFSFTADNPGFYGQWVYDYTGIARANKAIGKLTDDALMTSIGVSDDEKRFMLGQVYYLRAFYYFDLINNFGDVPMILIPVKTIGDAYSVTGRTPKADVTTQINADLAAALPLMPDGKYSDATDQWRVSKGAVLAMQAKVALYNQQWSTVITTINTLEGLGYFSLNTNYFDCFDQTKKFAENEDIFQYNHQANKIPDAGNGICAPLGWGFIAPSTDFTNSFEANDPRFGLTVDVTNKNVFKLLGTLDASNKGNDQAPSDKIYIRWADVLLWKAEAYLQTSDYSNAVTYINKIRQRARTSQTATGGTPPVGTLPDRDVSTTDPAVIRGWLISERRAELGFESQRFNDLKRWGIAKTFLTGIGVNFQDKNMVYPIPQAEIDGTGGTMAQNPDY
ncbi:RagB/SusD family nutrient uptake outer membrane protein [Ferruginibacter albus]|uniref:RagB/SusD family nutrient uptake outer membrane protein n=1 Tax=Ferruginibacter albus TaxID=2875540 RepID=UPI001CC4D0C2|nr:RagB/SusD family nutrient uptake outer membrane protein [Ferruginibacter albus]UAY53609.1 RagB/SusD family nutrient uptake outer membrane protein [Ferruginibacter albus]